MEMNLTLSMQGSGWTFLALVCAVCTAVVWYYRRTTPPVHRKRKTALGILRGTSGIVLLFLLFQPLLTISRNVVRNPHVSVLVDNTASMTMIDRLGDRREAVRTLLDSDAFQRLRERCDVTIWTFATGVDSLTPGDTLGFDGEGTDIARALLDVSQLHQPESSDIQLLISDGVYTTGENPVRAVERTAVPIYTVGVGDSLAPRDAMIRNVQTNELAYLGSEMSVGVTLASHGLAGRRAVLSLLRDNQLLQQETVTLPEDGREIRKNMTVLPATPGRHLYRVSLAPLDGELTDGNNHREFSVSVLENRRHITMIAGRPDAEIGFLRRLLGSEADTEISVFVLRGDGTVYAGDADGIPAVLNRTDLLILYDFPTARTPGRIVGAVQSQVAGRQLPVWYITGKVMEPQKRAFLQSMMPYQVKTLFNEERLLYPALVDRTHTAVRIRELPEENAEVWGQLPPVFSMGWALAPTVPTQLWVGIEPVRSRLAVEPDQFPLLFGVQNNGRKTAVWNGYGFWRWHLMTQQDSRLDDVYASLLARTVDWLINREDEKTDRVETNKRFYQSGESIIMTAQVYTEQYEPLDGAEVHVTVRRDDQTIERLLTSEGAGRYTTRLEVLEPGVYEVECRAEIAGRSLGEDSETFRIGDFSVEMFNTQQDHDLLVRLAEHTGGRYAPVSEAQALLDTLNLPATQRAMTVDMQFHDKWPILLCLVALLSLEWALRKRWGLL